MKTKTTRSAAAVGVLPGWSPLMAALLSLAMLISALMLFPAISKAADSHTRLISITSARKNTGNVIVAVGKSEDVRTDASFMEVMVGNPEIADVNPLTDRAISILGKKIGTTRVSIYAEGKKLVGIFDVEVSYDIKQLSIELRRQFPAAHIKVSSVNGRIMLSGTAPDGVTLDRAVTIAKQFGPEVINSVGVTQPQQVLLEVRFVEAQRNASRELGVNWQAMGNSATVATGTGTLLSNSTPFGAVLATLLAKGFQADVLIKALEDRGVARRLAEPNLVALSGETASFLAGGEFPFPVAGALNSISIEFKKFGVGLAFTPTVLANGLINLKIEPEVSQIDPTNVISIGGVQIPSLIVRRANTTVELRDGQSFAIAGLLQANSATAAKQLPWLGDIPVIGALFKSAQFQKNETDLTIIVTPRLVQPARPIDMVKTPLDNTLSPNDADFFMLGKHEVNRRRVAHPDPARPERNPAVPEEPEQGFILDLPKEGDHVASR
jgi:pilus assembly protein CpaC